jgi:hypothetical protein
LVKLTGEGQRLWQLRLASLGALAIGPGNDLLVGGTLTSDPALADPDLDPTSGVDGRASTGKSDATLLRLGAYAMPAIGLAVSPGGHHVGDSITFTASVAGAQSGVISFTDNGKLLATVAVNGSGVATFTTAALAAGGHVVMASFSGTSGLGAGDSMPAFVSVGINAPSSMVLSTTANPVRWGHATAITATITGGGGVPSGWVWFFEGARVVGISAVGGGGTAVCTYAGFSVGTHTVTAYYTGDANVAASVSAGLVQSVIRETPTITIGTAANPADSNYSVGLTVDVTSTVGRPTGHVLVFDGGVLLATLLLDAAGHATTSLPYPTVTTHAILVTYEGDTYFAGDSNTLSLVVRPAPTQTSVTASPAAPVSGQTVTLTCRVVRFSNDPHGTVDFYDGSTLLGTVALTFTGSAGQKQAVLAVSTLATGIHTIRCAYSGGIDAFRIVYAPSEGTTSVTVGAAATTTSIVSSDNPSVSGEALGITVQVAANGSPGSIPDGSVTLSEGALVLGTANLDGTGAAVFTLGSLGIGSHTLSATFAGNARYLASTATPLVQRVLGQVTMSVASDKGTSNYGDPVTATAHVQAAAGTPGGTIQFQIDGTNYGPTVTLASGAASIALPRMLAAGVHTIAAVYAGDTTYQSKGRR